MNARWKAFLPLLSCLPLALISMSVTGFQFGVNNNIFHIPYVLDLASSPEFAGDAFSQSLGKFTSALWPLVRLIANESNVRDVFLVLASISRLLALVAVLYLVRLNGVKSIGAQIACLSVVAVTPLMTGYSPIGSDGLFLPYFTHSEVTWPAVFMSLALMQRSRIAAAASFTGIAFALNAFVGIWMVFVNIASRIFDTRRLPRAGEILKYGAVVGLIALPVLVWISFAVLGAKPGAPFSYIEYVREFYPNHFLIEAASKDRSAALMVMFVCGLIGALHTANPRYWVGVQLSVLALLVVGSFLPYLINRRFIFNLHLLRADGLEQAVSILLCAMAAVKLWVGGTSARQRWMGVIVLVGLLSWPKSLAGLMLPVTALALLAGLSDQADAIPVRAAGQWIRRHETALAWLATAGFGGLFLFEAVKLGAGAGLAARLAFVAVALYLIWRPTFVASWTPVKATTTCTVAALLVSGLAIQQRMTNDPGPSASSQDWDDLVAWVRASDIHGVFLVPLDGSDNFQLRARRPVWVGAVQGAAVMWEPSFYAQWSPRFNDLLPLKTAREFIAYASAHQIRHVVIDTQTGDCAAPAELVKRTGRYALCRVGNAAGAM
ncbi:hypothetical protein [Variovorax sp. PBL-E5]|uniref:hypothetical protein n=1 Tax=Variovorax sp. PBL-E5 TaxID=434014 RepID=UPI00131961E4|nr:hypothetical protein [Variovorax sp. PBL-E5]VTU24760.1 hypothetical protein E5CHR_01859 [Variovorax sp. PBL-E5]